MIAHLKQRFADASDIAVAEDGPDARKIGVFLPSMMVICAVRNLTRACAVVRRMVLAMVQSLYDQARCAAFQMVTRVPNFSAIMATALSSLILPASQPSAASLKMVRPTAKPLT